MCKEQNCSYFETTYTDHTAKNIGDKWGMKTYTLNESVCSPATTFVMWNQNLGEL